MNADPAPPVDLEAWLTAKIRRDGPVPVSDYMAACLTHPQFGYYTTQRSIGAAGDFITAPEISQVFGELIGLWTAVVARSMQRTSLLTIAEIGPGRGTLMADALRALLRVAPDVLTGAGIALVEISDRLAAEQARTLRHAPVAVARHRDIAEIDGPMIIIGNEILDALPVRQAVFRSGAWRERTVDVAASGGFAWSTGAACALPSTLAQAARGPQVGDIAEWRCWETPGGMLATIAAKALRAPLAALFIDYGHAASALGETLQAVRGHAVAPPLAAPGRADLSAAVDFAAFLEAATRSGLSTHGPITQAAFLGRLGITERAEQLLAAARSAAVANGIEAGIQRLLAPAGMGGRFKVVAVASQGLPIPPGFA